MGAVNQTGSVPVAALWELLGTVVYFEGRRIAVSFREHPAGRPVSLAVCVSDVCQWWEFDGSQLGVSLTR